MSNHLIPPPTAASMVERPSGPLVGVRIIEVTHAAAGPFAALMLADMGADVIKVEPPGGEMARGVGPFHPADQVHAYGGRYAYRNRNKRSIVLDLTTEADREVFLELVDTADGLIENMRAGVLDRLGVGWDACRARNPRLVYAAIRGFGDPRTGASPYVDWPAYDAIAQAMGGLVATTGPDSEHPMRVGPIVGDLIPGLQAALGLVSALHHALRSGQGQFLDVAMVDGLMTMCETPQILWAYRGKDYEPSGNAVEDVAPFNVYVTKDGGRLAIAAPMPGQWRALCAAMGRPDLGEDPALTSIAGRAAQMERVDAAVAEWIASCTQAEVLERLGGVVPVGPVHKASAWADEPHVAARQMLVAVEHEHHPPTTQLACPIKFTETPAGVHRSPPLLDQHGEELRAEAAARRSDGAG
ncbi:MAG: CaiB/BaiF CoA transferase family protein [Acidimicrobiales bacterium]